MSNNKQELEKRIENIKRLKDGIRDVMDEIAVQSLHIRNELRKDKIDKSKIISHIAAMEEAIA